MSSIPILYRALIVVLATAATLGAQVQIGEVVGFQEISAVAGGFDGVVCMVKWWIQAAETQLAQQQLE